MLGRNGFPKAGDGGLKLEVTAQALVRHAPVEDQHGDMTFFASQHEAGPEFGFQQADHTRAGLIERLGLEREDVIACGDGLNDLAMIKYAGLGVAMGNAQPEIKAAADVVTGTNDEDGLVSVIEQYILNA